MVAPSPTCKAVVAGSDSSLKMVEPAKPPSTVRAALVLPKGTATAKPTSPVSSRASAPGRSALGENSSLSAACRFLASWVKKAAEPGGEIPNPSFTSSNV